MRIEELRVKAKESHAETVTQNIINHNIANGCNIATLQQRIDDDSSFPDPPAPKPTARVNVVAAQQANVSPRTMADAIKVSEKASEPLKAAVMNAYTGDKGLYAILEKRYLQMQVSLCI